MPTIYFVTGASRGFGAEFVKEIIERGDKVIAAVRTPSKCKDLEELGATLVEWDVTSKLDVLQKTAKDLLQMGHQVDCLIANAGYILEGVLEEVTEADIHDQFNTNVFGLINTVKAFLPHMRSRKAGTIVTMGSIGGWYAAPAAGLYCATKHAVRGIAATLVAELSPFNIKVLHVEPGYFRTDFLTTEAVSGRKVAKGSIEDYDEVRKKMNTMIDSTHNMQPGDPAKGVAVVLDPVTGTGIARGKELPWHICLGSDAFDAVTGAIDPFRESMVEWKEVTDSTDFA